ncbi:MAG: DUF4338 domain-containing protein [Verrucomicrobiota bacterium]|nr:DUF4338 domain-containing protein [Verrucomicrobiota bacterium]
MSALHPAQARDALAALERLQAFYQSTGRRVSLLAGISAYCEAAAKLNGRTADEAVEGYLRSVAGVRHKDIAEAVAEFLQAEAPRAHAPDGQRAQLSREYASIRAIRLGRFADTFPNTAVCDLTRQHLDAFIAALDKMRKGRKRIIASAKSRNHYRAVVRQFLAWCVRKDYLPVTHRLLEADGFPQALFLNGCVPPSTPRAPRACAAAVCGQNFTEPLLNRLRETIQQEPKLSRRALSHRLCEWLDWKRPNGRLKEMSARCALLRLHREGRLRLPQPRCGPATRRPLALPPASPRLEGSVEVLPGLELTLVRGPRSASARLYKQLIAAHHYLGYRPACGAQMRYLISCARGVIGALSFLRWEPRRDVPAKTKVIRQPCPAKRSSFCPWWPKLDPC